MAPRPLSFAYKCIQDIPIYLDVFPPILSQENNHVLESERGNQVPAVVFFHGGGLTVGNRTNWFPTWLKDRTVSSGFAFIAVDYQLIPPSSGHEIVGDIKDLFLFLQSDLNKLLQSSELSSGPQYPKFQINPHAIAVAGCSAGGLCAYLAAIHATPKPAAVVSFYGMGGNFLTPHYFSPKSQVFFRGREMLDPNDFKKFLHPLSANLPVISDSPLSYHPSTYMIPGYPSNPRMLLARLYLQMGVFLDYYTGLHEPSLSLLIREASSGTPTDQEIRTLKSLVSEESLPLFPQFNISPSWPPTFLAHGEIDSAVPSKESSHLFGIFKEAGVKATLRIVEGQEHSFDYAKDANELFGQEGGLYDEVAEFLRQHLRSPTIAN